MCTNYLGQACRKLDLEESPTGATAKKKRPQPKTPRPKKKKTDVVDGGGGGDGPTTDLGIFTHFSKA